MEEILLHPMYIYIYIDTHFTTLGYVFSFWLFGFVYYAGTPKNKSFATL